MGREGKGVALTLVDREHLSEQVLCELKNRPRERIPGEGIACSWDLRCIWRTARNPGNWGKELEHRIGGKDCRDQTGRARGHGAKWGCCQSTWEHMGGIWVEDEKHHHLSSAFKECFGSVWLGGEEWGGYFWGSHRNGPSRGDNGLDCEVALATEVSW